MKRNWIWIYPQGTWTGWLTFGIDEYERRTIVVRLPDERGIGVAYTKGSDVDYYADQPND